MVAAADSPHFAAFWGIAYIDPEQCGSAVYLHLVLECVCNRYLVCVSVENRASAICRMTESG